MSFCAPRLSDAVAMSASYLPLSAGSESRSDGGASLRVESLQYVIDFVTVEKLFGLKADRPLARELEIAKESG